MGRMMAAVTALALLALSAVPARAEVEVSVFTGWQTAPHSEVTGSDPGGIGDFDFTAGWDGDSFQAPPHYGVRVTWWPTETFGWGVELNHAKVYADDETLDESGFDRLEFTDGLNLVTVNAFRRWPDAFQGVTPYIGGGVGVAVPHVDVESDGGDTYEYQLTGPAVVWMAGLTYDINETWAVFGEYKGSFSSNEADLDNGGTLETDIITNALNFGVSYRF